MNIQDLEHRFTNMSDQQEVYVLLHGISEGLDSEFMQNINARLEGKSVFMLTMPYLMHNEDPSEGLVEEYEILNDVAEHLYEQGYGKINIIGKSLGTIIASRWLRHYPHNPHVTVHALGYVIGDVDTGALKDHLGVVVQGEFDRFGNAAAVEAELQKYGMQGMVIEVPRADHSYRDAARNPIYQDQALDFLFANIAK